MFTTISPSVPYFGSLVALLTTCNPAGTTNITPISSAWSLGDHYVLGLSSHHQGYRNLIRTEKWYSIFRRNAWLRPSNGSP